jgi:hypothetical protein
MTADPCGSKLIAIQDAFDRADVVFLDPERYPHQRVQRAGLSKRD